MSKTKIRVAIVSDVVCPWCYIGKRRFENAVAAFSGEADFEIAYYPFELNPDLPADGVDQKDYLSKKFGGDDAYDRLTGNVTRVAASEGLEFNFEKQKISPNTRNAHRLILIAREENKQEALVEALFKAYFTDGVDLSKTENLTAIAVAAGLAKNKVEAVLQSDTALAEVKMAEAELQRMGIRGVPFYIINDKFGISGAQSTQAFLDAFRSVSARIMDTGEVCDVDKENC